MPASPTRFDSFTAIPAAGFPARNRSTSAFADAWNAFRLFAEPDSADLYSEIELIERSWRKAANAPRPADAGRKVRLLNGLPDDGPAAPGRNRREPVAGSRTLSNQGGTDMEHTEEVALRLTQDELLLTHGACATAGPGSEI